MILDTDQDIEKRLDLDTEMTAEIAESLGWKLYRFNATGSPVYVNSDFVDGVELIGGFTTGMLFSYRSWGSHCFTVRCYYDVIENNRGLLKNPKTRI